MNAAKGEANERMVILGRLQGSVELVGEK